MNNDDPADSSSSLPAAAAAAPAKLHAAWWRRPAVAALGIAVLLLTAAMSWPLLHALMAPPPTGAAAPGRDLPWRVQPTAQGGSQVFGLNLGLSTLADVKRRFGGDVHIGLIVPIGDGAPANPQPALEGFVESFQADFITGKLVLAFDADPNWAQAARQRAPSKDVGEGGRSRRYSLTADDALAAEQAPLVGLTFLPSAKLDETTISARFGAPSERHVGRGGEVQLLYPAIGVAAALEPPKEAGERVRTVIQYVAPRDFEARLRAPLFKSSP